MGSAPEIGLNGRHWARISTFDILDRATNIVYRKAASTLANFDYLYNTAGMITQKVAKIGSSITTNRYSYDDLDRLTSENISGAVTSSVTFFYDLVGNRTQTVNSVTNRYSYSNGCDRLVSWGTNNESTASYSAAGCVTGLFYSATNKLYLTWNGEYQLTSVATGTTSAVVERNAYDALGRRASSWGWDGATTTNFFLYDGANLAADVDRTGGMRRAYAYGPGIDNILSMTVYTGTTVKTYFYLKDHLGTVHAVTDSTGTNIVERYVYDAWGKLLDVRNGSGTKLTTTAIGNRWLWQGREYSWRTGLYFFRARYYIPQLGRWCSPDPIGINGGLNQTIFCSDDPINNQDPSGLVWGRWGSGAEVGFGESLIPIWGSGRQAINDYSTGHYVWGTVNTAMAVSDIFLIKTIATIGVKGAWKVGSATWGATRKWLGKQGYAEAGQHVHHGIIPRSGWGKDVPDWFKNQPWNLKPLDAPPGIDMNTWHRMVEGKEPGLTALGRWWEGTPDWLRYGEISGAGRLMNASRDGGANDSTMNANPAGGVYDSK